MKISKNLFIPNPSLLKKQAGDLVGSVERLCGEGSSGKADPKSKPVVRCLCSLPNELERTNDKNPTPHTGGDPQEKAGLLQEYVRGHLLIPPPGMRDLLGASLTHRPVPGD